MISNIKVFIFFLFQSCSLLSQENKELFLLTPCYQFILNFPNEGDTLQFSNISINKDLYNSIIKSIGNISEVQFLIDNIDNNNFSHKLLSCRAKSDLMTNFLKIELGENALIYYEVNQQIIDDVFTLKCCFNELK